MKHQNGQDNQDKLKDQNLRVVRELKAFGQ